MYSRRNAVMSVTLGGYSGGVGFATALAASAWHPFFGWRRTPGHIGHGYVPQSKDREVVRAQWILEFFFGIFWSREQRTACPISDALLGSQKLSKHCQVRSRAFPHGPN